MVSAPSTLQRPGGRVLAYDDVGDPGGVPVVYLHGTPDSRLGRPPDEVSAAAGVRLLAVDRPGFGDSDHDPASSFASLGEDLVAVLEEAGVERGVLLGWSGGGLAALGAATHVPFRERLAAIGLVGTLPPAEAYEDERVMAALGDGRRAFAEIGREVGAASLAADVAPYLVPQPLDDELARAHVLELAGDVGQAELERCPGAVDALASGLRASIQHGVEGLAADVERQLEAGIDLAGIGCPVRTFHGSHDEISPPEVGTWLVAQLPNAVLDLTADGGHHLLFPRWRGVLRAVCRDAGI